MTRTAGRQETAVGFAPLRTTRVFRQIAARIVEMVRNGELKPGDSLPNEAELASAFDVSRNSVREALIALETAGVVEVRRNQGVFVRELPLDGMDMSWDRTDGVEPGPLEQFEIRESLEPDAAARAATQITPDQIAELETIVQRMQDRHRYRTSYDDGRKFAEVIAAASGNSLLLSLVQYLWRLRDGPMWTTLRKRVAASDLRPSERLETIKFRRKVIRALRARDSEAARAAYGEYLLYSKHLFFSDLSAMPEPDHTDGHGGERPLQRDQVG